MLPSTGEKAGLEMPSESGLHGHNDHPNTPHSKRMTCNRTPFPFEHGKVPLKESGTSDVNSGQARCDPN